ncbi:MAG: nitroreductase family protein [Pseudoflavonifractor sp.]|nr:nitroreductase family protein [Alloprevotella sp.]MCM1116930.1 nitroreductase family protein [Pseudoflavonifractor sp.]
MKYHFAATAAAALAVMASSCGQQNSPYAEETSNATLSGSEAVMYNILTRTSVRQFTSEPVSIDTLNTLVRAGMAAPTALNKQPWEFVVVNEHPLLDSLAAAHPHSNLATAAAAIIVCGNMQKTMEGKGREYWIQDCSAATENILLAAHSMGLGAVWCGVYPMEERVEAVSKALGLPAYIIPLNVVTLGHPDGTIEPKDKWNPEAIHFNAWSAAPQEQQ